MNVLERLDALERGLLEQQIGDSKDTDNEYKYSRSANNSDQRMSIKRLNQVVGITAQEGGIHGLQ